MAVKLDTPERRIIRVQGIVQGVGFRPYVYRLAVRHGLQGYVRNETSCVAIEVEGVPVALDAFLGELSQDPPPNARITRIRCESRPPRGDGSFRIDRSCDLPG